MSIFSPSRSLGVIAPSKSETFDKYKRLVRFGREQAGTVCWFQSLALVHGEL